MLANFVSSLVHKEVSFERKTRSFDRGSRSRDRNRHPYVRFGTGPSDVGRDLHDVTGW